jgi:hypothetical protein
MEGDADAASITNAPCPAGADASAPASAFHAERGDPFRALALAERVCAVAPEDLAALVDLAGRRLALGLFRPARQTLEEYFRRVDWRALETDPGRGASVGLPAALALRAELFVVENRFDEALRTLEPARSPGEPPAALVRTGRDRAASRRPALHLLAVPELVARKVRRLALARCRGRREIDLSVVLGPDDVARPGRSAQLP